MAAIAGRVLILPRGVWKASETYTMLDMVLYKGKAYVARNTSTNQVPVGDDADLYWMLMIDSKSSALEVDDSGYVAIDYDILS